MNGQWLGILTGTNAGNVTLELDEVGDHYEGVAYFYDDDPALPGIFANIRTPDKSSKFEIRLQLSPLDPDTGGPTNWDNLKARFPNADVSQFAESSWEVHEDRIEVSWSTNAQTFGKVVLPKSRASELSEYQPEAIANWAEFRNFVSSDLEPYRYIFRGQTNSTWRLRTHFYRTGRADLLRFIRADINEQYNLLTSQTRHIFNLNNPVENGAFYTLAQHHGYPTPLLDWTHSPYKAEYFAYKSLHKQVRGPERKTRIFVFDRRQWEKDYRQLQRLSPAQPHFSILNALGIDNPRMLPQQALSSVTNVDDIETYIRRLEQQGGQTYLRVIDLPSDERKEVMQELALMGITAGSLFPGLDGACEQLRERFFDL